MRILGPPSASLQTVQANLAKDTGLHPRFLAEMCAPLWNAAVDYYVDPVGVIAQAYKESGAAQFKGKVRPEFCNPCGLKVRYQALTFPEYAGQTQPLLGDQPLAHAMFPNWEVGALAHVQHLLAYAGAVVEPPIVDPRYVYVVGKNRLESFAELGGKWAPSATYGIEIEQHMARLSTV